MKKNEIVCAAEMDQLHELVEQLNFLCRANTKIKGKKGYMIDTKPKNECCDSILDIINNIKKGY